MSKPSTIRINATNATNATNARPEIVITQVLSEQAVYAQYTLEANSHSRSVPDWTVGSPAGRNNTAEVNLHVTRVNDLAWSQAA